MTRFEEQLQKAMIPRYVAHYLDYKRLKQLIYQAKKELAGEGRVGDNATGHLSHSHSHLSLIEALEVGQRQNLKGLMMAKSNHSLAKFVNQWGG